MQQSIILAIFAAAGPIFALSGRATTTRYDVTQTKGACGCGPKGNGNHPWKWQLGFDGWHTAAVSQTLYGSGADCGSGCGKCYTLTDTGKSPTKGKAGKAGQQLHVLVTNLCPPGDGNEDWCRNAGVKNQFGTKYHFDIATDPSLKEVMGDNPYVDFVEIECPAHVKAKLATCHCPG